MLTERHARALLAWLLCMTPLAVLAQETPAPPVTERQYTLAGKVTAEHSRDPIVGATVELVDQRRVARTDAAGKFTFTDLPVGAYRIVVRAEGYADRALTVDLPGDPTDITLDLAFHEEPVLVTASPTPKDALQIYQPTGVLDDHALEQRGTASLGTTLQNEPGISSTNLGTAPSRPVIRGMGGDRVLILEDGIRVGDVSSVSPDHAVAINPEQAERIEIVRGPANLLYGSNAMGGVINVINGEIPSRLVNRPTGQISVAAATNSDELAGRGDLAASTGPIAMRAGWSRSDAGEFEFPGGTAGNSQYDFTSYHAGASWVGSAGYAGVGYRRHEGDYGIPVDESGMPLDAGERGVTIGMEQDSYKLTGQITKEFGPFTGGRAQVYRRDYSHTEFEETGEAGTTFDLQTVEARADLTHKEMGKLRGTFGGWYLDQGLETAGEEALLPQADLRAYAGFFYEELGLENVSILFGGRWDDQRAEPGTGPSRSFAGLSGALGAIFNPDGVWSVAANVSHNFKAPSVEELYANGPHIATFTFEVGDDSLEEESSIGYDLSFRWSTKRFSGEVTGFRTDFADFIFLEKTGAIDPGSGLPIAMYRQADALFQGVEAHADFSLLEHLTLELVADQVRATQEEDDQPLPQIPPYRIGLGLNFDTDRYGMGAEVRYAGEQDRVAPNETPTDDYAVYNAFAHVQFPTGSVVHRFALRGENLTDELYRNHVSLVKDIVPQPGRSGKLTYTLLF